MKYTFSSVLLASAVLAACSSNPTSGPSFRQVTNMPTVPQSPDNASDQVALPQVAILDMNEPLSQHLVRWEVPQSLAQLDSKRSGSQNPDAVGLGDVLEITIWESAPALLFGGSINSSAEVVKLPEQMVDAKGTISIPFLGRILVRGKTPTQIQEQIVSGLRRKANQPQALVRIAQNHSANATIIRAGKSVRMPLTSHRERVLDAVAAVGGVESGVQDISLQLTRGNQTRTVALETVTADPSQNIVLQAGDVMTMHANPLSFTALGAVSKNQRVEFAAKGMKLSEAMGAIGGLIDRRSDPRGIFIFRYQTVGKLPEKAKRAWHKQGYTDNTEIPTVYRFDLNEPQSFFWMQRFAMHDKDVIYVANAPASEIQKFLQLIFSPVVSGVNSVSNLTN